MIMISFYYEYGRPKDRADQGRKDGLVLSFISRQVSTKSPQFTFEIEKQCLDGMDRDKYLAFQIIIDVRARIKGE